jgi:hypothetical protein
MIARNSNASSLSGNNIKEDNGEVNQTLLAVNFRITQTERLIGAAFINMQERSFTITEFAENEHLSGLESLIMQQNNSAADCKFRVLINLP